MCTVTFIPRSTGYYLAMNRDEQLKRIAGLPPARRVVNGRTVLCPSEPGGGTWITLNDSGSCFALINWYSVSSRVNGIAVSRGEVVNSVNAADARHSVDAGLARLPLDRINPFRLIGIFPADCEIAEWSWDLKQLIRKEHRWKARQWISSGFDEPTAQRVRSKTFEQTRRQKSAGSLEWLRRLHRSHSPEAGPFSTCMHRVDAASVSYSEVAVSAHGATLRYGSGAPCQSCQRATGRLRLASDSVKKKNR